MNLLRLVPVLVLAALTAAPAWAGSHRGGVGQAPSAASDGCYTRRVTGPGGAYRWERTECEAGHEEWSGYDQWGYGQNRVEVDTRGDRYGERRDVCCSAQRTDAYAYEQQRIEQQRICGCLGGYDQGSWQGRGGPIDSYPPPYAQGYAAAGRDEYGWLTWPGKRP